MQATPNHAAPAAAPAQPRPGATPPPTPSPVKLPAFTLRSLLRVLWERASPHMTPQELRWLAEGAPELTSSYAQQLETVLENIACLVLADGNSGPGGGNTGCFQSSCDVPDLLFSQVNHYSLISGLGHLTADAAFLLRQQATARP